MISQSASIPDARRLWRDRHHEWSGASGEVTQGGGYTGGGIDLESTHVGGPIVGRVRVVATGIDSDEQRLAAGRIRTARQSRESASRCLDPITVPAVSRGAAG